MKRKDLLKSVEANKSSQNSGVSGAVRGRCAVKAVVCYVAGRYKVGMQNKGAE